MQLREQSRSVTRFEGRWSSLARVVRVLAAEKRIMAVDRLSIVSGFFDFAWVTPHE